MKNLLFIFTLMFSCSVYAVVEFKDTVVETEVVNGITTVNTVQSIKEHLWSDSDTWGGVTPTSSTRVHIPKGKRVILDTDALVKTIVVDGELVIKDTPLTLETDWILVRGKFKVGTPELKYQSQSSIILAGGIRDSGPMGMGGRSIISAATGSIEIYTASPDVKMSKISSDVAKNGNRVTLENATDWEVGNDVVLTTSDFVQLENDRGVKLTLTGKNTSSDFMFSGVVPENRFGRLQYLTDAGVALMPGTFTHPDYSGISFIQNSIPVASLTPSIIPTVLDERSEVINLSRRFTIVGKNDSDWANGVGAQIATHGPASSLKIDGPKILRGGHAGILGRYPIHFHMKSYAMDGTLLPDTTSYAKNLVIEDSVNRCIVVHGTNGAVVKDNACFKTRGHAIFLEDAVERRNVIDGNMVVGMLSSLELPRCPLGKCALQRHEDTTPAGFWLTNPDNTVINNLVSGTSGKGYWLAFPDTLLGINTNVKMDTHINPDGVVPAYLGFGEFKNNEVHGTTDSGIHIDNVPTDTVGGLKGFIYQPTTDGEAYEHYIASEIKRFELFGNKVWKTAGLWNRDVGGSYLANTLSSNTSTSVAGAGNYGLVSHNLFVGRSFNVGKPYLGGSSIVGSASYHSTFSLSYNAYVNFEYDPLATGPTGVFDTVDYYFRPVDRGTILNKGNILINAHPGRRIPSRLDEFYNLAGAIWDPYGYWGPAGNYTVQNDPIYYGGSSCVELDPAIDGWSCPNEYIGIVDLLDTDNPQFTSPIEYQRVDNLTLSPIATLRIGDGSQPDAHSALSHFRDFAAIEGQTYIIGNPLTDDSVEYNLPTAINVSFENMKEPERNVVVGIRMSAPGPLYVALHSTRRDQAPWRRSIDTVGLSVNDVRTDPTGQTYFVDTVNNIVWVKPVGGLTVDPITEGDLETYFTGVNWNTSVALTIRPLE